jgi:hypothetical protein
MWRNTKCPNNLSSTASRSKGAGPYSGNEDVQCSTIIWLAIPIELKSNRISGAKLAAGHPLEHAGPRLQLERAAWSL